MIADGAPLPSLADVTAVLPRFTGPIEQVPPAYSALMIDGERAYDRARAGEAVELKARSVTVYSPEILPPRGRGTAGRGRRPQSRWWRGRAAGSEGPRLRITSTCASQTA